jgi:16S rRNA (adenine1518-N6/adenine1519-N6)-dimethyltransferase
MLASPSTKDYGSLAVWVQALAQVEWLRRLPSSVFWPRPKVSAAIVRIRADAIRRARIADVVCFHHFVRTIFLHRRKNLRGVLASAYRDVLSKSDADRFLADHGLTADVRAEQLSVEQLIELANDLHGRIARSAQPEEGARQSSNRD